MNADGTGQMTPDEYARMSQSIGYSMRRYPKCRVASCECDEFSGEWVPGCFCGGHFRVMDKEFGEGNWSMSDMGASAKVGKAIRAVSNLTPPE